MLEGHGATSAAERARALGGVLVRFERRGTEPRPGLGAGRGARAGAGARRRPATLAAAEPESAADPRTPDDYDAVLAPITPERMLADVAWLSSRKLSGRGSYQAGGRATARWVVAELEALGLEVRRQPIARGADNIVAIKRAGPEAVVIGAHYDHLGIERSGVFYPGADDNASGLAALLAIARALASSTSRDSLVFIAFGAEEDVLQGSGVYVASPLWPLEHTRAMVNFDMVGRNLFEWIGAGKSGAVAVVGLEASEGLRRAVVSAASAESLAIVASPATLVATFGFDARTDDWWFRQHDVPTAHFTTGLHADYHQPSDTPARLKPDQMARIARTAARTIIELAGVSPPP
jgi:hypothetical protein